MLTLISFDDEGNCEETTVLVKTGVLNLTYIQGLYLKNPKSRTNSEQVKLVKALEKHLKIEVLINFKWF